jgi:prephenate dehydratase/chorismate mutase/prephenate dehydratase
MRWQKGPKVVATLVVALSLVGCGGGRPSSNAEGSASQASSAREAAAIDAGSSAIEVVAPNAETEDVTTVAYLGPEGTYTEEAAKLFFGNNDELMPQETVADALAMVVDGTASYAVIPQENALGGPVTDYIDALLATDGTFVVGEVELPIRQTLMGLPGTDLAAVTRVVSHKQGLAQSANWLDENLPNAERVEAPSTAAAAQEVATGADPTSVAIAAPGAADLYGLEVLQENVSQSEANKTRFYVVSKKANGHEGYMRAVFVADISADELPAVLAEACVDGTKLVCAHDRPDGSALGSYHYVIELSRDGGFSEEELLRLQGIEQLEYLGSFGLVAG